MHHVTVDSLFSNKFDLLPELCYIISLAALHVARTCSINHLNLLFLANSFVDLKLTKNKGLSSIFFKNCFDLKEL